MNLTSSCNIHDAIIKQIITLRNWTNCSQNQQQLEKSVPDITMPVRNKNFVYNLQCSCAYVQDNFILNIGIYSLKKKEPIGIFPFTLWVGSFYPVTGHKKIKVKYIFFIFLSHL